MQRNPSSPPFSAALHMVTAMAIIGVIDNFIIRLADEIGLWQFHLARSALMLPIIAVLPLAGLGALRPRKPGAVALRSFLVALAMLFYFSALALMPIAQALAGLFTSPIFILLITALTPGNRIGPWRSLAVLLGFAGILLVLQPDPSALDLKILVPVAGGFFYALAAIATRSLCAGESTVALLAGMMGTLGLMGAAGLLALALVPVDTLPGPEGFVTRGWVWPMSVATPWVALQAVGSLTAVFLIIKSYQMAEPSQVSVFEYAVMIFGPLFAWMALGQDLGVWQMAGIALIFGAGLIIALRSG